ncbi:MAG: glycosyltransferase family 4 protein, partial [Kiritimatiellia bacterium]|nr:glycosyltransferase family 4 protein [Kiritimatiellia bacterium]
AESSTYCLTGGAARILGEQAIGLKKRGHNVGLLVRAPPGDSQPQIVFNGIPEFRYGVCRKSALAFVLSSIIQSIRVFDHMEKHLFHPDVVVIHQSLAGFGALLFRRKRVPAWVYNCHSLAHEEYLSRNTPKNGLWPGFLYFLHAKMRFWIERWTIRRSSSITVESQFMKERVISNHRIPQERIHVVPAAADITRFKPCPDKKSLRVQMRLPGDRVILFTVRNLVPRMGLENLIKAVAEIEKMHPHLLVIIGGAGPLRQSLEQLIGTLKLESKVILKGFIPENDLAAWYQCADLVVMPTYALEGFGLVTVEALACGTPVLGTPVGATPEILGQIDSRLISKGNDAHSIAEALTNILALIRDNPVEWNNLSKKGLQRVAEVYNWEKHCEKLESVLLA